MTGALWEWSLATYARPGVKDACLRLQDEHGWDVNVALWCLWAAARGRSVAGGPLTHALAASEAIQAEVVAPLRAARRGLRGAAGGSNRDAAEDLRGRILELELAAERYEQHALEPIATDPAPADASGRARAARALAAYAAATGTPPEASAVLLEAVLA